MSELIKNVDLNGGEHIAISAVEVTSIPGIEILRDSFNANQDIETEYRASFQNLLSELFQTYQNTWNTMPGTEIAVELLWLTEPVENQPYKAGIRLYFVFRVLSRDTAYAGQILESSVNLCISVLKLRKYGYRQINPGLLSEYLTEVPAERSCAIVKAEGIDVLQSPTSMQQCYSFSVLNGSAYDLGSIVNSLIEHPYVAMSMQLITSSYQQQELAMIGQVAQIIESLSDSSAAQSIGQMALKGVERLAEVYKYYRDNRGNDLFWFNLVIQGPSLAVSEISTKVSSFLTSDSSKHIELKTHSFRDNNLFAGYDTMPWVLQSSLLKYDRNLPIWNQSTIFDPLYRMPFLITAEEASGLFRLPIGAGNITAGMEINRSSRDRKTYAKNLINAGDIEVGTLKASGGKDTIGISLNDLAKHMLIVGSPGCGKTTFSVSLLDRLWKEHHIPFLVIEPAKNEYRSLVQSIPDLQVFTPGKNFISPFVFNPFVPPENVRLETYKSTLRTAFAAGVSMTSPLDKIFEETINNCYSDFRWLDSYTIKDKGQIFNITDFIKCFEETFEAIGYTGDARNIGRAGLVRLNSLVNLFDSYSTIPIRDMLEKPTVIELAAIENSDQKALIIALILLSILAYVNANYIGEGGLKNVILLEEAHVLLDASSNGQADANPSIIAQGLVKRMLAEIRSYGVGLIIADQSPRKVTTDVVALTDMKMVFRIVEAEDKQIMADSMNMSEAQLQRVSRLRPGEAFLFFNRLEEAEEVITPDYRLENNISISLSDEGIKELSTYWNTRGDRLRPYPQCSEVKYCSETCDYNRRLLAREIARRIYKKNLRPDSVDPELVESIFKRISKLVMEELNDEPFSPELLGCVKTHLWRKIKYNTKIKVRDEVIANSLRKA